MPQVLDLVFRLLVHGDHQCVGQYQLPSQLLQLDPLMDLVPLLP